MRHVGLLVVVASVTASACASRTEVGYVGSTAAPDPAGCYVLVFDQPEFMGRREYINGPRKYATLSNLPFQQNWRRRIRGIQTGPRASVTMWTDEAFAGTSQDLRPDARHSTLIPPFDGQVESIDISCGPL